jgi:hypothetical protein
MNFSGKVIVIAAEKNFENKVKQFLKEQGCWVLKTWGGGLQRSGIPDLLVSCNGHFVGVEVKAPNGEPSKLQIWNLLKIDDSGGFGWLLYPKQFEAFKDFIICIKRNNLLGAYEIYKDEKGWVEDEALRD